MPLPADGPPICIFGDSHLACIKMALDGGLIDPGPRQIEFWGADGPNFRAIRMEDGRLRPANGAALDRVRVINGNGRDSLGPEDFPVFFFYAARLRAIEYLVPLLWHQASPDRFLSRAVREAMLWHWLESCRAYRNARAFAAAGKAEIYFAPAPFNNEQAMRPREIARTINEEATAEQRAALWDRVEQVMADDGIQLVRQPEETVTRGCLSRAEYAVDGAAEARDPVHKNSAYGALLLAGVLERTAAPAAAARA